MPRTKIALVRGSSPGEGISKRAGGEMVDTLGLGPSAARRGSSSLPLPIKYQQSRQTALPARRDLKGFSLFARQKRKSPGNVVAKSSLAYQMKSLLLNKKIILLSNIALAVLWGSFVWRHSALYLEGKQSFVLLFILVETILVFVFLFRKKPKDISIRPIDWSIALAGTFSPLLFTPSHIALSAITGNTLLFLGTAIVFLSYLSLNRSFGIVPADRGIKTEGLYRLVRHPMYLGYIVLDTGYVVLNASSYNVLVFLIIIGTIAWRIRAEEMFFESTNKEYTAFKKQTRFALLPFVY